MLAAVNNLTTGQGMHIFDDHCLIVQLPDALGLWNKNVLEKTDGIAFPVCEKAFVSNKTDIKLNIVLGGMTPLYFHIVNVCLHCTVTCLLMHVCQCHVFENRRLAFVTALLFAVHPVHTEAVSGIVGRADVLACLLFLLTFLSYISGRVSEDSLAFTVSSSSLFLSLLLGTCAMLVKETGITVFGVCLLYDALSVIDTYVFFLNSNLILLFYSDLSTLRELLHICSPFIKRACLITGYVSICVCIALQCIYTGFLTYSYLLSFNAWLLLAPIVLCYDWRDSREVLVGLLFLVFPFIPASNLFFRVGFVVAERVLYMPSELLEFSHCHTHQNKFAHLLSLHRTFLKKWFFPHALFPYCSSGIQTLPHNAKVHYNYANFLKDTGRHPEAIHHYTTALRLYPRHASAMNNLGTLTRSPEEAEMYYRKALETNPQHNRVKWKQYYLVPKRFSEANEVYLKGIENCPDSSDLHNNYGVFLVDTGQRAAAHYQQAVRLKPAHYVAMVNLGRLLRSSNENQEAESWYKRALQVTRKVDILTPLGALYYNTGRYEEALQVYREAVALQPESTDIWLALAQVLAMAGRTKEAEKMMLDVISRKGNCIECYRLLSAIYSKRGNYTEVGESREESRNPLLYHQSYKLAVELKPDQSQAWMNMGGIQHIKYIISTALKIRALCRRSESL
uniref:dolichyl-phosphate-mannose--protein mannosyltransferase n=1 Tax=Neolamprologus brichardi TaxID=32507 RepID=A0A3Q4M235_NEOBR